MDLRREILRNVVLCQTLEPLARKSGPQSAASGPKLDHLVAGVNSAWPFYDLADRVLTAGRQPDCIFDVAYEAQASSVRNGYGGKVNFGQITLLVPLVTAQVLDFLESGTHEDIESILGRTGDVLRNTTEKDVESLQSFMDLQAGNPKSTRAPVLKGRYASVWETCHDRQKIPIAAEMLQGYAHCLQVYRFLLHNLDSGILQASTLILQILLAEIRRPDVVADIVAVGLYLVLTKHPESVLLT